MEIDNFVISFCLFAIFLFRPQWAFAFERSSDEKEVYASDATLVELEHSIFGSVFLTNKKLYFHPKRVIEGSIANNRGRALKTRCWVLECLNETYGRRHLLKNCGIELFFSNSPEIFIAFESLQVLQSFFRLLRRQNVPSLVTPASLNPKIVCERMNWTDLWKRRLISNFEYLMKLNTLAGRSFNDITQYPVFPWILADYTSEVLDLDNPATFRDFSKPVGALDDVRLAEVLERYKNSFDDVDVPKFMYGSHYSSPGVVLHYLIRQEPFTRMAIHMQGGKFDCPDRLFFDINSTWRGIHNSISDVKELIPELFYSPEFLVNSNKLPLGQLQDGTEVDDVVLPPWAKNDPFEFVRLHKLALESDYVSENLCHWIDLIFGYKQTGEAAILSNNVFYHLTYENAVDINEITDPLCKEATISQVTNFGQTPAKLFDKSHVKRNPKKECISGICLDLASSQNVAVFTPSKQFCDGTIGAVVSIRCSSERLMTYHSDMTTCVYKWSGMPDGIQPFQIKTDKAKKGPSAVLNVSSVPIGDLFPFEPSIDMAEVHEGGGGGGGATTGDLRRLSTSSTGQQQNTDFNLHADSLRKYSYRERMEAGARRKSLTESPSEAAKKIDMILPESGNSRIVTCGYWDQAIRLHSGESLREIASSSSQVGEVTCVQLDKVGRTLITSGMDGTCRVWLLERPSALHSYFDEIQIGFNESSIPGDVNMICVHVLCGHQSPVTSLYYSSELDLVLSGSEEGTLCLHTARKGEYIRTVADGSVSIDAVFITPHGFLLAHSWKDLKLQLFWLSGARLANVLMFAR